MPQLGPIDALVGVAGVGAILALGFSARLRESSALQFLAAGRSLTLPFFVATLVSTWYGGILGIGESVSYFGLGTLLLMGVPYYVFGVVYAIWYSGRVREGDQISIPERLAARFGKAPGLAGAGLVFLLGIPAAHVLMLGTLVTLATGLPLWVSVCLGALGGSLFLIRGGLLADVKVSVLAFAMMYIGFGVLLIRCLSLGSPWEAWQVVPAKELLTWNGGQGPLVIFTFFLLGAWTLIDPGFHQRAAAAATPAVARKGILASVGCWLVFDLLTISTAMYALALGPKDLATPLLIHPAFALQVLPDGLRGLFLLGILGTVVSAMVGYALVSGGSFGRDMVCQLRPGLDETKWSRIGIGVSIGCAVLLAMNIPSVVALWYSWGGCIIGALLIPVSASYSVLRLPAIKPWGHAAAMAAGFGGSLAWLVGGSVSGNPLLNVSLPKAIFGYTLGEGIGGATFSLGTLVPSLALSAIVTLFASWVCRDEPDRRNASSS